MGPNRIKSIKVSDLHVDMRRRTAHEQAREKGRVVAIFAPTKGLSRSTTKTDECWDG